MSYLAIGALVSLILLLPVASWIAIGRRGGLPASTRRALKAQRKALLAKLPPR